MLVKATRPPKLAVAELWYAQYCVPKPLELLRVAVLITYWTWVFALAVVLPKCEAARTASLPSWLWVGCAGAALALSNQTPPRTLSGLVACVPDEPQVTVPVATPWQYCVTELFQELPPTWLKKLCWSVASPEGSLLFHWEPQ